MKIHGIGKDIGEEYTHGRVDRLHEYLAYAQELGYTVAEIDIAGTSVIFNGELIESRVQAIKTILDQYNFRYTAHAPNRTNLAYRHNHALEKQVLVSCIKFCHAIGAKTLVYHSGLQALDAARHNEIALPSDDELAHGATQEIIALQEIAPIAEAHDVVIGLENGDPHLWEYVVLHQNNKPAEELPKYHQRLRITPIIETLEAVDHPNIGMTLDLAHLFLAMNALDEDYLAAVSEAQPWVRHLHMNDNFGKLDTGFNSESDRLVYGEADLHMPPGWGAIPLQQAFARLELYEGDVILEIKERFWDFYGDALQNTQALLKSLG